jgi:hypothetical protein
VQINVAGINSLCTWRANLQKHCTNSLSHKNASCGEQDKRGAVQAGSILLLNTHSQFCCKGSKTFVHACRDFQNFATGTHVVRGSALCYCYNIVERENVLEYLLWCHRSHAAPDHLAEVNSSEAALDLLAACSSLRNQFQLLPTAEVSDAYSPCMY